jgi:hypothetical protein
MKLSADQKQEIYNAIDKALIDFINCSCTKGNKTDIIKSISYFTDAGEFSDSQTAVSAYKTYVAESMKDFRKWKEAGAHNWLGFLRKHQRIDTFIAKYKLGHYIEIAGKQGESSWTF